MIKHYKLEKEEMLIFIVRKALENDWLDGKVSFRIKNYDDEGYPRILINGRDFSARDVLLDHGFAKAFFGDMPHSEIFDPITSTCNECGCITRSYYDRYGDGKFRTEYCYEFHLQQAVIARDLIKYYYNNI